MIMRAERRNVPHEPDWDQAAGRAREESQHPHRVRDTSGTRLVAVFESEQHASSVAASVAGAIPSAQVAVGSDEAHVASLRGEMAEESSRSVAGPSVGLFTHEMARGATWGAAVWALIGAVVALPFAFIPMGSLPLGARLIIVAVAGAVAGGTFGFVAGGAAGAKGPAEPLAAESGVSLIVKVGSPRDVERAAGILAAAEPIRLDEFQEGIPEARRR